MLTARANIPIDPGNKHLAPSTPGQQWNQTPRTDRAPHQPPLFSPSSPRPPFPPLCFSASSPRQPAPASPPFFLACTDFLLSLLAKQSKENGRLGRAGPPIVSGRPCLALTLLDRENSSDFGWCFPVRLSSMHIPTATTKRLVGLAQTVPPKTPATTTSRKMH